MRDAELAGREMTRDLRSKAWPRVRGDGVLRKRSVAGAVGVGFDTRSCAADVGLGVFRLLSPLAVIVLGAAAASGGR